MSEETNPRDVVTTLTYVLRRALMGGRSLVAGRSPLSAAVTVERAVRDLVELDDAHPIEATLSRVLAEGDVASLLAEAGWPVLDRETPQAALARAVQAAKAGGEPEPISAEDAAALPSGSWALRVDGRGRPYGLNGSGGAVYAVPCEQIAPRGDEGSRYVIIRRAGDDDATEPVERGGMLFTRVDLDRVGPRGVVRPTGGGHVVVRGGMDPERWYSSAPADHGALSAEQVRLPAEVVDPGGAR